MFFFLRGSQIYAKTPTSWRFLGVHKNAKMSCVARTTTTAAATTTTTTRRTRRSTTTNTRQKMCGKMVTSCGMTRTSHFALHLRARAEHMNNTNAHTTIHTPYDGIAGVRSATIHILYVLIYLSVFINQCFVQVECQHAKISRNEVHSAAWACMWALNLENCVPGFLIAWSL